MVTGKYFKEHPQINEEIKLTNSQEAILKSCMKSIAEQENKEPLYTFFAISGEYGSGKTHIATAIGTELKNKHQYNCRLFNIWSTNPASIRRQFLMHLIESEDNCSSKNIEQRRKELAIKLGEPLPNKNIAPFILIWVIVSITLLSLLTPIINIFLHQDIPLTIFTKEPINLYFITGLILASIIACCITKIFYYYTGGTIYSGSFSIFGLNIQNQSRDIDEYYFKKLFISFIEKNTYIILDDVDRVSRDGISNAIQFLELIKECSDTVRREKNITVAVCVPINIDQLRFLLTQCGIAITDKEGMLKYMATEKFMHKVFQQIYKPEYDIQDVNVILKNRIDETELESIDNIIKDTFQSIPYDKDTDKRTNLRQLCRNIEMCMPILKKCLHNNELNEKIKIHLFDFINNNSDTNYYTISSEEIKRINYSIFDYFIDIIPDNKLQSYIRYGEIKSTAAIPSLESEHNRRLYRKELNNFNEYIICTIKEIKKML